MAIKYFQHTHTSDVGYFVDDRGRPLRDPYAGQVKSGACCFVRVGDQHRVLVQPGDTFTEVIDPGTLYRARCRMKAHRARRKDQKKRNEEARLKNAIDHGDSARRLRQTLHLLRRG